MIGPFDRAQGSSSSEERQKGFDDYEVSLGDLLRGERATMGKSLLDVQRELKIRASYIAAIENSDPTAFDSPGFIAGYVRSYARYLKLDAEWVFEEFCKESGHVTAHGMSAAASSPRMEAPLTINASVAPNQFENTSTPFVPVDTRWNAHIDLGALASVIALLAVLGGLGVGGMKLLQEVQKVQVAPVEQTPIAASDIDPLAPAQQSTELDTTEDFASTEALDRLYRPPALDVPVLVSRDAPIATLDPRSVGVFAPELVTADAGLSTEAQESAVQVVEGPRPEVVLFAAAPTWVRVRGADSSILFEKVLDKGEEYTIPVTEETPILRAGNAGSLYFKVNGKIVGPAGEGTELVKDVLLASEDLSALYTQATPSEDQALFDLLDTLDAPAFPRNEAITSDQPSAVVDGATLDATVQVETVTLFAIRPAWVRVRDDNGRSIFEKIMEAGEIFDVPAGIAEPVLRAGNAGSVFVRTPEGVFGPLGTGASVVRNVKLTNEALELDFTPVDVAADPEFMGVYNTISWEN
ncbi:MAG: RodZ domain-containing protein [Pseudomonadota bacterium]